ncbi:MAG: hydrolase, partial [Zetaproteobacteria bacterium CG_4_9_14_3_um_filter_53_7]
RAENPAWLEQVIEGYRDSYRDSESMVRLFPHVSETLEALRERGYWLGVVTGKSHPGLLRVLDTFKLADQFLVLRTADCTHSKPHPAMVLECMHEMGVTCGQTVVVGDALFDVQMARAAHVRSIGVSFGVAAGSELMAAGAQVVVDHFAELLEHFPPLHSQP